MFGKRLMYVVWILFVFYFWVFQGGFLSVVFLSATVVLSLYGALSVRVAKHHVVLTVDAPAQIRAGKKKSVLIQMKNNSRLPLFCVTGTLVCENVLTKETTRVPVVLGALPGHTDVFQLKIRSDRIGCLDFEVKDLKCTDLLGVFSAAFQDRHHFRQSALILPPENRTENWLLPGMGSAGAGVVSGEERFGIRDYQDGERMGNIHWKATSKLDELMVREQIRVSPQSACLFLETVLPLGCEEHFAEQAERRIRALLSLSRELCEQSAVHEVCYYREEDGSLMRLLLSSIRDFQGALEQLLRVQFVCKEENRLERFLIQEPDRQEPLIYISERLPQGGEEWDNEQRITCFCEY